MRLAWALFALLGCRYGFTSELALDGDIAATCWPRWHAGDLQLSPPKRVAELASTLPQQNPSLSFDGRTLYFERDSTTADQFVATRPARDAPWGPAVPLTPMSNIGQGSRMTTSADAMLAIIDAKRSGRADLYTATRATADGAFGQLSSALVGALNTGIQELDPELTADGLGLYYAPFDGTNQRIVVARRPSPDASFGLPTELSELQLSTAVADPTLSPDETVIAFSNGATRQDNDLYYATRASRDQPFGPASPLAALNVPGVSDNDIELSTDGCELYFTSDRGGRHEIYVATVPNP